VFVARILTWSRGECSVASIDSWKIAGGREKCGEAGAAAPHACLQGKVLAKSVADHKLLSVIHVKCVRNSLAYRNLAFLAKAASA
jgi:hypothetical protein